MASEIHALVLGFDHAYVIRDMVAEILQRYIQLKAFVDSKTVFDVLAKQGKTCEKLLQIDIHALRESYDRGELTRVCWIPGATNPADALKNFHPP